MNVTVLPKSPKICRYFREEYFLMRKGLTGKKFEIEYV